MRPILRCVLLVCYIQKHGKVEDGVTHPKRCVPSSNVFHIIPFKQKWYLSFCASSTLNPLAYAIKANHFLFAPKFYRSHRPLTVFAIQQWNAIELADMTLLSYPCDDIAISTIFCSLIGGVRTLHKQRIASKQNRSTHSAQK